MYKLLVEKLSTIMLLLILLSTVANAQQTLKDIGIPHSFPKDRFVEQSVWLPYWSERDHHHSLLHVRNLMLHTPLDVTIEIYTASGKIVTKESATLEAVGNLDLDLDRILPTSLVEDERSGSARISFVYPLAGVIQAEVSVLDNHRNHAYTIVGRPAHRSEWNSAFLAFRWPTPNTYLEVALFNPLETAVTADLQLLAGSEWQDVENVTLPPREMRKLRIPSPILARSRTSSEQTALLRATYSASVTEIVANAWLEDETTGFSNTVLFHEGRPESNELYGSQLVAYGYPKDLLPEAPDFAGHLVLANVGDESSSVSAALYCEIGGKLVETQLPPREIAPESTATFPLNSIVSEQFAHASGAICSVRIAFTGKPGTIFGRYFGESSTLTYGLYSKLEPGIGRAYNELYWSIEGDRTPVLTVTNFSESDQNLQVWATRDKDSVLIRELQIPANGSIHLNLRSEFDQRSSTLEKLNGRGFGGFHIRAERPTSKILVKEHIFSLSRSVSSPYYGATDVVDSHEIFVFYPELVVGGTATVRTLTCYYSGCQQNEWPVRSHSPSKVSLSQHYMYIQQTATAHQTGSALLYSTAYGIGPYGGQVPFPAEYTVDVYDATPSIGAIVPNTIPTSGSQVVEIYGAGFGSNPIVTATGGITVSSEYTSPQQINVRLGAPITPTGAYLLTVTSNGQSGYGFLQAPGGGGLSQPTSPSKPVTVNCAVPTGEGIETYGWADAENKPAIHKFVQYLVPLPNQAPTGVSFAGRTVTESTANPGVDGCWFPGSIYPQETTITGGSWTIGSENRWGPDYIGWETDRLIYYRAERISKGLPLPCDYKVYQRLTISSCGPGSTSSVYRTNLLLRGIIWATEVGSERSGVLRTRPLVIQ